MKTALSLNDKKFYSNVRGLRDFFFAATAKDMEKAFYTISDTSSPPSQNISWQAVEFEFNRLFVGPDKVLAPLFSSVYLDNNGVLMGEHTIRMRELMRELHLAVPVEGSTPEDFLPYELDVLLILHSLIEKHGEDTELHKGLQEAYAWLVLHLGQWIPLFLQRARTSQELSCEMALVLDSLEKVVHNLCVEMHATCS